MAIIQPRVPAHDAGRPRIAPPTSGFFGPGGDLDNGGQDEELLEPDKGAEPPLPTVLAAPVAVGEGLDDGGDDAPREPRPLPAPERRQGGVGMFGLRGWPPRG